MLQQALLFEELIQPPNPKEVKLLDLLSYDKIIISTSGGKDSLACVLYLLKLGIPKSKLVLWHQIIDGKGIPFMDWPVTESYCKVMSEALGIPIEWQWRDQGFYGELLKENDVSKSVKFSFNNETITLPTTLRAVPNTRRKFPAKSADLRVRWCSSILKIDVFARSLNNHPTYKDGKFLVITGERREESYARARYLEAENHPCNTKKRTVHWWRSVIDWTEEEVWSIIEEFKVRPHPAYILGWNRTSCLGCVFQTPDLWHMMREIAPDRFNQLAQIEREINFTIDNKHTLEEMANMGRSRIPKTAETSKWVKIALEGNYSAEDFFVDKWKLPAGAFHGSAGGAF